VGARYVEPNVLGMDCNQGRMAQRRHGARRVTAQGPTFGLRRLPASATELDSRFDFFTPTAGHLGRAVAKRWTADEVVRLGQTATEAELIEIRGPALVPSDQLASLKETLISANGLAAMVAVVGSPVMAQVVRDLALEQRRWLLALDRDDPSAASDALANAHPALRAFQEAARTEANEVSPT